MIYMNKLNSFFNRHSITILSAIASFGVASTAVLSASATFKATKILDKEKPKTKKEKFKAIAPVYIPTFLSAVSTISCIVSTNIFNKMQQASLASAYALLNNTYREYRNKLKELHGPEADLEVISNIASEKFPEEEIPEGLELFYDQYSHRYFKSTMENVILAVYNLNKLFAFDSFVTINDLYDFLEIPRIDGGDVVGWSRWTMGEDGLIPWIDIYTFQAITCDGKKYYIIDFTIDPIDSFMETL